MKRTSIALICLIGLSLAGAASCEGAGEGVLLRYLFKPGEEFRYRLTMSGDMGTTTIGGMAPPPGAAAPRTIPTVVTGTYELGEKVISVSPEGLATVSVAIRKLDATTSVMGMKVAFRLGAGGKLETRLNGQPMKTPPNIPDTLPNPLYDMKLDPTGKVSMVSSSSPGAMTRLYGDQNVAAMFNSSLPGMGMVMLPEKPVKAGDTWESQREVQVPVALPGLAGGGPDGTAPNTALTLKAAFHNELLRVENGRAVIETQVTATVLPGARIPLPGGATAPSRAKMTIDEMDQSMTSVCADKGLIPSGAITTIDKMDQSMTGTERFNIEQGVIEGGDNEMKIAIVMGLPVGLRGAGPEAKPGAAPETNPGTNAGGAAPAFAPNSLRARVDGTLKMKIERLTVPPAAGMAP